MALYQWRARNGGAVKKEKREGYFQVSLMNVFRQAAAAGDARQSDDAVSTKVSEGERTLSTRTIERRDGAGQDQLRTHLAHDLSSLMSTTHLEAAEDLKDYDYVRRSILNYGMQDMTRMDASDVQNARTMSELKAALIRYEPRLIPETVEIQLASAEEDVNQRLAFDIRAEMAAKPVDVPLEFTAEIDTGAGKVSMANLVVRRG